MPESKPKRQSQEVQKLRVENAALNQENLKLERRIVRLEAALTSAKHRIRALQERIPIPELTDRELEAVLAVDAKNTQRDFGKP